MKDLEKLAKALRGDGFPEETILLCAGRSEGRRLLQQCAADGACLVGVSTESPLSLAMDICSAELAKQNAPKLLSDIEAAELILDLLCNNPPEYYSKDNTNATAQTPAVAKELLKVFRELDMACIESLSGNKKLDDTQALRTLYQEEKVRQNVIDRTDLFKRACEIAVPDNRRYVALSSFTPTPLEQKLLDKLVGDKLTIVPIGAPDGIELSDALCKEVPRLQAKDLSANSRFYRCRGMETEVRFVFRDILEGSTPVEDCAIIYLSGEYAPQIYETAARFNIPVSMSAGIPMSMSAIFSMIAQLTALPEQNYDTEQLCGLLTTYGFTKVHPYRLADQLRKKQVYWGKDRYLRFLSDVKNDPKLSEYANDWNAFFTDLFSILEPSGTLAEQQQAMLQFLLRYTNRAHPSEAAAYAYASKLISEISVLRPGETVAQRLVELMESGTYLNASAQPGQLFCAPLSQALCTGRQKLYILGLSRYALQGSDRQSPILNETDRTNLGLKNARLRENENTFRLLQAVLQHEGEIIFCYPDFDSERMIEQRPSPVYLDLKDAIGAQENSISYIPATPMTAGDHILLGSNTVPYSANWSSASQVQLQPSVDHQKQIEGFAFSCSSLEKALRCPLQFYLENILQLRKPNVQEYRYDKWLSESAMGTFCHRVLEKYYQQIMTNITPDLDALIQEVREQTEQLIPVPSKELQDQDLEKARIMIDNAIAWTTRENRSVQAAERHFGKNAEEAPITLTINQKTLLLSGSIDRVDLVNGQTAILDYKTGSAKRFQENSDYHLQHYLYTLTQEQLTNQNISEAGYLFLDNPAEAKYFPFPIGSNERQEMAQKMESLLEWLADEEKCMEWAPCMALNQGKLEMGSDSEREKQRNSCRNFCIYSEFCENLG